MKSEYFNDYAWLKIKVNDVKKVHDYSIVQYSNGDYYLVSRTMPWYGILNVFHPVTKRLAMKISATDAKELKVDLRDNRKVNLIMILIVMPLLIASYIVLLYINEFIENYVLGSHAIEASIMLGLIVGNVNLYVTNKKNKKSLI